MSHALSERVARGLDPSFGDEHVLPEVRVGARDGDATGELGEPRKPAKARRRDVRGLERGDLRDANRRAVEERASTPLRPPALPERRSRDDADDVSPPRSSAISVAQIGSPRAYCFVPSIGSSHQRTSPSSTPNSSPATASPRSRAMRARNACSTARSASVTGVRSSLVATSRSRGAVALQRESVRLVGEGEREGEICVQSRSL